MLAVYLSAVHGDKLLQKVFPNYPFDSLHWRTWYGRLIKLQD